MSTDTFPVSMKVTRVNSEVLFEIENSTEATALVDGPADMGGQNKGMRPMEMLLGSLATCSALDIVHILEKQRQELTQLSIQIDAERRQAESTKPYKSIHLHYILHGDLKEKKVDKAIDLALNKYCSVKESLNPEIEINYSFDVNPE